MVQGKERTVTPDALREIFSLPKINEEAIVSGSSILESLRSCDTKYKKGIVVWQALNMQGEERRQLGIDVVAIVPLEDNQVVVPDPDFFNYPVYVIYPDMNRPEAYGCLLVSRRRLIREDISDTDSVDKAVFANARLIPEQPLDLCRRLGHEVKEVDSYIKSEKARDETRPKIGISRVNDQMGLLNEIKHNRISRFLNVAGLLQKHFPGLSDLYELSPADDSLHVTLKMLLPHANVSILSRLRNPSLPVRPGGRLTEMMTHINTDTISRQRDENPDCNNIARILRLLQR